MFTVETATLTFSYGTDSQTTVNVTAGDHKCHDDNRRSYYVCGNIPNGITKEDKIKPELFEGELQLHGRKANQRGQRSVSINLRHLPASNGATSSLSLRDPCPLYEGVCHTCKRSCFFLYRGTNEFRCDGSIMTKAERNRVKVTKDDLPFLIEMERFVDVTNRKIICVVLRRPVHELGNVWRYLRYISNRFVLLYTDETNKLRNLDVFQSNVCKNILPMEEESDTAAYCNFYSFKPKYVKAISAGLGVEAYNVDNEKYVMSPQAIGTRENFKVSVQQVNVPDGCKDITCSTGGQCIQSCQQIYTSNAYYCSNETISGIPRLHEATVRVESSIITDTIVLAGKREKDRHNLHTTATPSISTRSDETTASSLLFQSQDEDGSVFKKTLNTTTTPSISTRSDETTTNSQLFQSEEEESNVFDQTLLFSSFMPQNDEMEGKDEEIIHLTTAKVEQQGGISNATGGKSADDSTTGPYESGEMDDSYIKTTSEYSIMEGTHELSTFTSTYMEKKGEIQNDTVENSGVNSSTTRQPDRSEMNGNLTTSTTPYSTIGKGIHKQSTVATTDKATEGKIQSGNSADLSSTKGRQDIQEIRGSFIRSTTEVFTTGHYTTANMDVQRQEDEIPFLVKEHGKIDSTTKKWRRPFFYSNAATTRRAFFPLMITFLILNISSMF